MPTTVQLRRGSKTQNEAFTGASGELSYDTTLDTVRVHDGSTAGGFPFVTETYIPNTIASNAHLSSTYTTNSAFQTAIDLKFDAAGGAIGGASSIAGHFTPAANNTYDLGSAGMVWRDVYIGPGSLYVNGKKVIEDNSDTITITTDVDQNLKIKTEGTGVTQMESNAGITIQTLESADIILQTSTGNIEMKGTVEVLAGKQVISSDGNAIQYGDALDMNSNKITELGAPTQDSDAATKLYVDTEVAAVVNAAPETLNTLNELASALGDDANFATTLATNLGQKLGATASITLSGDVSGTGSFSANSVGIVCTVEDNSHLHEIANITGLQSALNDRILTVDAQALANARLGATSTVELTGDVTGSASFSSNAISITTAVANDSHTHDGRYYTETEADTLLANKMSVANTRLLVDQRLGATATVNLTGDVTGSASFSGNSVSITTSYNNDVVLGTDTSGNYVSTISGTLNEIEVTGSGSETAAVTIGLPDDVTVTGDLTVSGGDITLGGVGRIQGIDTVSAGTDAANKTYVDNAVAGIVDSAPAALDTLNELAAALGDDANFATTLTTNLGQKLGATATVTLTGDVTGTASFSANAVSIATTYNNDVVLGTDTSGNYVATITAGTGISGSSATEGGTPTIALSHLGLESLTDPNADRIAFWDDSAGAFQWLSIGGALSISGTELSATDTNTTYSAGAGLDLTTTTFSIESDLRGDVTQIGQDTNDYYSIGTTTHSWYLDGAEDMRLENDGDLHVEGDVVAASTTVSDERLKENITVVEDAVAKIQQLRGVEFDYKPDGKRSAGAIAQDVEKVLPQAVTDRELPLKSDDGIAYKTLQYDQLSALFIEAIKEQASQIEALKAEIEELKK